MPGFNLENINIHDLTVEEPEKQGIVFDLEREISKEDWEMIKDQLMEYKKTRQWAAFDNTAAHMKILDPSIELGLDEHILAESKESLKGFQGFGDKNWDYFTAQASDIKILYPEADLNLDEAAWQEMRAVLENDRVEKRLWHLPLQMMRMKILDPSADISLNTEDRNMLLQELKTYKSFDNAVEFAATASATKAVDSKVDVGLDQKTWNQIKDLVETNKNKKDWNGVLILTMFMKFLVSEKVEITDKGVEITMPEKKLADTEVPLVPEQRKF